MATISPPKQTDFDITVIINSSGASTKQEAILRAFNLRAALLGHALPVLSQVVTSALHVVRLFVPGMAALTAVLSFARLARRITDIVHHAAQIHSISTELDDIQATL